MQIIEGNHDRSTHLKKIDNEEKPLLNVKMNHVKRIGSDSLLRVGNAKSGENEFEIASESQDTFIVSPCSFSSDDASIQRWAADNFDPPSGESQKLKKFFSDGQSYLSKATQRINVVSSSKKEEKNILSRNIKPPRISFQQHLEESVSGSVKIKGGMLKRSSRRKSFSIENWPPLSSAGNGSAESFLDQASTRRSSASEFIVELPEESPQQLKRKNKSYSQSHSINPRMIQNRLRLSQPHEFLSDLRNRRKSKLKRRTTIRASKMTTPLDRFRRMVRLVRLLLRCLVDYQRITIVSQASQMSFAMLSNDMVAARTFRHGLTFDPNDFKVSKETLLNDKLREILTILPHQRTQLQIEYALKCLRAKVEEFAEFPLNMQQALVKVAWLDEFEPKRVIIRQGHSAETFYFILYGTALVTRNRINSVGEGYVETVSILKRGKSFGELAIMRREQRANNVVSHTRLALLTVGRKDFIEIFMHRMEGGEPDFISFLRKIPEFEGYPLYKIPHNKPLICAFTYFRVGVVICPDSTCSDVIVIVRSGICRVIKRLPAAKPNLHGLRDVADNYTYEKLFCSSNLNLSPQTLGSQRAVVLTSPLSSVSPLIGPRHPSLKRRFTLSLIQTGKLSFSQESELMTEYSITDSTSALLHKDSSCQGHKRKIWSLYRKWQEDHPISRRTLALLMTGRGIQDEENNNSDEENNAVDDQFDTNDRISFAFDDGAQNRFRTHILKRNRSSLSDVWALRQRKKASSVASNLPALSESKISRLAVKAKRRSSTATTHSDRSVYIHIQTLREGDVFGLIPILFEKFEGATSLSLISDGAECILINKDFFFKHLDSEMREKLVRMVQPYPSDTTLETNLQDQTNWDAYKFMTVHSLAVNRMKLKKTRG